MRRPSHRSAPGRAVIAVAALYALVLQAFLGTLQPIAPLADPTGILCAAQGGANGQPADPSLPCRQHACCLPIAAIHAPIAPAQGASAAIAWPSREAVQVAWRPADAIAPRAPPDPTTAPRGPPAA